MPGPAASSSAPEPLAPAGADPEAVWEDYFSKRRPAPADLRKLLMGMHEARRHDHVAAAIRAAVRNGQGQPWMYEVLAITLRIQGAPQEEVERALLSGIDFAATDAASLTLSAAYLTRFEADRPALKLYRQASELAPERPEPYILGLKLAAKLRDDDALAWAARGVFATAWGKDGATQRRDAENAAADRATALRKAGKTVEADRLATALAESKQVDLRVRLTWSGEGALDLAVREPSGTVCGYDAPRTAGGGVLTHDGHGPKQENCFDEYVCAAGFAGVYRIEVRHAWGDIVGKRAKLVVTRHAGTPHETTREFTVPLAEDAATIRVTLADGRREELLAVPDEVRPQAKAASRGSIRQLVGRLDPDARAAAERFQQAVFRQQQGGGGGVVPAGGVGAGAVGYNPLVTVLSEGATLSAQAVVSGDRRYVRLTLAPTFSAISDVLRFSFATGGN